jgi:hypothetical protein
MTLSVGSVAFAQEEPTEEPASSEEVTADPTEEATPEPTEEATPEPTEEATPEPTEEATPEPTEEVTAEPTEEATAEPTEEATAEPTEEATPEPTEEVTAEPTEEATAEPTEEATAEPTEEPTVEPTEEPTVEPTSEPVVESAGEIEAQAYSGSFSSSVAVQNVGAGSTDITIQWYKNGAASACETTSDATTTGLQSGEARLYTPPEGSCGTGWTGSAVVSGGEPLAAIVSTMGSTGQLLSEYTGGGAPTTEDIIIPQTNNVEWDPLIGISNAGTDTANVTLRFLNRDGTEYDTYTPSGGIPAQSGIQVRVRDVISGDWKGSISIEQSGTAQPLYAVNKSEREIAAEPYPVSIAYEGWPVSAAKDEYIIPTVNKRMKSGNPNGQNMTIGVVNPSSTDTAAVTIEWFNNDGSEVTAAQVSYNLDPLATRFETTRDNSSLPAPWSGFVKVTSTEPVIALAQPWVAVAGKTFYKAWAVFTPVDPNAGTTDAYAPSVYKQSSGGSRISNGWNTNIVVVNLDTVDTNPDTNVRIQIFKTNDASTAVYDETVSLPPNGKSNWYMLKSEFDSDLGTANFFGGAKLTVTSGPGTIVVSGNTSGNAYGGGTNATSDAYGFYNGVNQ